MVTRVRIEAEGRSTQEVEETLQTAFEVLDGASRAQRFRMFGPNDEALVEAQAGEFVVERFVRESGAIFYRGRQVAHYRESEGVKLKSRAGNGTAYRPEQAATRLEPGNCRCGPTETCSNCPQ